MVHKLTVIFLKFKCFICCKFAPVIFVNSIFIDTYTLAQIKSHENKLKITPIYKIIDKLLMKH